MNKYCKLYLIGSPGFNYIKWDKLLDLGLTQDNVGPRSKLICSCHICGSEKIVQARYSVKLTKCKLCVSNDNKNTSKLLWQDEKFKSKVSSANKEKWNDEQYRTKILSESAKHARAIGFKKFNDCKLKLEKLEKVRKIWTSELRKIASDKSKLIWSNDELLNKASVLSKQLWQTKEHKEKHKKAISTPETKIKSALAHANRPRCSSLQLILYSILDDLNIKYYREYIDKPSDKETIIGPWSFDCVIPRSGQKTLLIECNGSWVHSKQKVIARDLSKSTYISEYHNDKYELKTILEHEFACKDKVIELIKYLVGITKNELVDFQFKDVVVKNDCVAIDYKDLLSKYHYIGSNSRGGIAIGGYLDDKLIAVCMFSTLVRQNIIIKNAKCVRELSRFCIHPQYQKKNFASWFISRCLKLLPKTFDAIIAYSDTTFNHSGSIYKACGFTHDKTVKSDYWYRSSDGWIMHKKTLYNKAVNISIKENEYADKYGYQKVYGSEKLRFVKYL